MLTHTKAVENVNITKYTPCGGFYNTCSFYMSIYERERNPWSKNNIQKKYKHMAHFK